MLRVAVIGATGFTGEKLVELLLGHSQIEIVSLFSRVEKRTLYSDYFPRFKGRTNLYLEPVNLERISAEVDVVFLSLPHTVSFQYAPFLMEKGKTVIDLSADYRLKNHRVYEEYYKVSHTDIEHLSKAVYGLPEINRKEIADAKLIANPGCYPTVSILSLLPVIKSQNFEGKIILDAKSGITGAGRKAKTAYHYAELSENMYAYKLFDHQHLPEIKQSIEREYKQKIDLLFTPQIMGFERGIYVTAYITLKEERRLEELYDLYEEVFAGEKFVRIFRDSIPQLRNVKNTNFCDIGLRVCGKQVILCACIDNLMKGAASQAIQNMNIVQGFEETAGLL